MIYPMKMKLYSEGQIHRKGLSIVKTGFVFCVLAALTITNSFGLQATKVDTKGGTATVKLEHVVSGFLTDINGKYKLRVTEITYAPGGYTGGHHHVGPGIRVIMAGELTYTSPTETIVYKPGNSFYESGDVSHKAFNKGKVPLKILNFELLPATWTGGSGIPVTP